MVALQMSAESIQQIQELTTGQSENNAWHLYRVDVITASKCHDILSKMKKKSQGKSVGLWSHHQKVPGMVFVKMDVYAVFFEFFSYSRYKLGSGLLTVGVLSTKCTLQTRSLFFGFQLELSKLVLLIN